MSIKEVTDSQSELGEGKKIFGTFSLAPHTWSETMKRFSADAYPTAGIGIEYVMRGTGGRGPKKDKKQQQPFDPVLKRMADVSVRFEPFDYMELQPPHFIFIPKLYEIVSKAPILIHVSQLSLGSIGIPMDREFLRLTKRLIDVTRCPWVSEHISWTRFQDGDTRHFILPFLDRKVADTIVSNALDLRKMMGVPILLENAPRGFHLNTEGEPSESEFIRDVLERSGSGFLLDIDSAIETAEALKYNIWEYLHALPLERLIEVHVADPSKHWDILRYVLENGPVKAVTIQSDSVSGSKGREAAKLVVERIRPLMSDGSRLWNRRGVLSRAGSALWRSGDNDDQEGEGPDAFTNLVGPYLNKKQPEMTEFRVSEMVSFNFVVGKKRMIAQELNGSMSLEFPLRLLPIVEHFSDWRPIYEAFALAERDGGRVNISEVRSLLIELIQNDVLVVRKKGKKNTPRDTGSISAERSRSSEIWSRWGPPSLNFYLASRTHEDEPYFSPDELESRLAAKAKSRRQPSSFKDYAAHPFYPLDNPFQRMEEEGDRRDSAGFLEVLLNRRTCRSFSDEPMTRGQLSKLLYFTWGSTGVTKNNMGEDVFLKKTSPSGGSLHGVEVYPMIMNVKGIENGLYHYSVRRHGLELLSGEDPRQWMDEACGGQKWISQSAAVFLSTSVLHRTSWKYESSRALRVILHDIGHLSQTFCLVATWLGLGSFTTAALRDEIFEKKIGLDYLEEPVFLLNGAANVRYGELGNARPREELE